MPVPDTVNVASPPGPHALARLEIGDARWSSFVAGHPEAQPCHHPAWAALLAECYGFEPFALAWLDERGEVLAGLPVLEIGGRLQRHSWVSLPFTDFLPPLAHPSVAAGALSAALDDARARAHVGSLEVRGGLGEAHAPVAYRHTLALAPDFAEVFAGFHRSQVQRAIRRTERDGQLHVTRADTRAQLEETYFRLHLDTRRRLGAPAQPRRFFGLLWDRFIEPGLGFVLLAHEGTRAVAGAVFLQSPSTTLYKYGASDARAWRLRPNHLLMWSAIQDGCTRGARTFDFGRTELHHQSLRDFKLSWGTVETPLAYRCLTASGARDAAVKAHPLLAATIRRSPALVCRVTGELLYRFAA